MVLRIYLIFIAVGLVGLVLESVFESEQERRQIYCGEKYIKFINNTIKVLSIFENCFYVLFTMYNVFVFFYCIAEKHWLFMIMSSLLLLFVIFTFINNKVEAFRFLTDGLAFGLFIIWLFYTAIFSLFVVDTPINEKEVTNKSDLVNTIDILEFTQAPYNNITGRRYYVKSAPSSAYYYEVRTENGGTTTKVIDGSSNYVEKFESDEYLDNPHIDIYRNYTIEHYITWYGNEVTKEGNSSYSYYIYTPENSMFYEK